MKTPVSAVAPAAWRGGLNHVLDGVLTARMVPLLLALFGGAWLWLLAGTARVAPVDNLEQLTWVRSLEWGYYKHPPLPTWVLAPLVDLFGPSQDLTYLLGAVFVLGSLALFWHWLRSVRGPHYATVALLATLCVTFYTGRLYYYNHNVVMLLWVVLAALLTWRLTLRPSLAAWLAMGVVMGLGLLTKYQIVIAGTCVGLWWLRMGWWRQPVHRWGAVLAVGVAALLFWPHLQWLITHDWMPLRYAESTSIGVHMSLAQRPVHALVWAADWMFNRALPAWIVLALASWWAMRRTDSSLARREALSADDRRVREFMLLWGTVPIVFMVMIALLGGVDLQKHWGTAFVLFCVPAAMELLGMRGLWRSGAGASAAVRAAWVSFVVVQLALMLQYWSASPTGLPAYKQQHWNHFPAGMLTSRTVPVAREVLGGPIDIISGSFAVAQAMAIRMPERPRVLIAGELKYSPWISPEELKTARVIEVFPARELPPGARWAVLGWAWRPGVSQLSSLTVHDWKQMRRRPELADSPPDDAPPGR